MENWLVSIKQRISQRGYFHVNEWRYLAPTKMRNACRSLCTCGDLPGDSISGTFYIGNLPKVAACVLKFELPIGPNSSAVASSYKRQPVKRLIMRKLTIKVAFHKDT